jgi:hypothetical protein
MTFQSSYYDTIGKTCATLKQEKPNSKHVASSTPGDHNLFNESLMNLVIVDALIMPRTCCGVFLI